MHLILKLTCFKRGDKYIYFLESRMMHASRNSCLPTMKNCTRIYWSPGSK